MKKDHTNLKIYIESYKLLEMITHTTKIMRRDLKYSLGEQMNNSCLEILVCIFKANKTKCINERVNWLVELEHYVEVLGLLVRLAHDLKVLGTSKYSDLIPRIDDIKTQCRKWKRYTERNGITKSEAS
jgi:hypothetical protein